MYPFGVAEHSVGCEIYSVNYCEDTRNDNIPMSSTKSRLSLWPKNTIASSANI